MKHPIRIIVADDSIPMRAGLRALLKNQPGMIVVAEAGDGITAVKLAAELSPDVMLMDIDMPQLNGIEAARQITMGGNGPKIIALSGHSDSQHAADMLEAGASAYVLKTEAWQKVVKAIHEVLAGNTFVIANANGRA